MRRTFGFCRRYLEPGAGGRMDLEPRYPECMCLLTQRPLFSLFPAILHTAHGLRLLFPGALDAFVRQLRAPEPFPLQASHLLPLASASPLPPSPSEDAKRNTTKGKAEGSAVGIDKNK